MATDWASDVKKYAPDADDNVIAGIVRYCGIALQKVDSSLVAFSDPVELARVRNNFLKKKCGLTDPDDVLDAAIAEVGDRMKADRTKKRVTVYYLLADRFGMHSLFVKAAKQTAAKSAPVAAAAAGAAGLALVGTAASTGTKAAKPRTAKPKTAAPAAALAAFDSAVVSTEPVVVAPAAATAAPPVVAAVAAAGPGAAGVAPSALGHWNSDSSPLGRRLFLFGEGGAGKEIGLFLWVALGLMVLAIAWLLLFHMAPADVAPVAPAETVAAPPAAPAVEAAVPEGAGIITETRDAKPVIKVYFATGKAEVAPAFGPEAAAFKTYLDAHQGSVIGVSGYNDPTGNAAVNAALSKKRAQAVKAALVAAQIPDASIELIKPEAATDATVTAAEARRVEVFVK